MYVKINVSCSTKYGSAKDAKPGLASFKPTFEAIGLHLDVVRSIVRGEVLRTKIS